MTSLENMNAVIIDDTPEEVDDLVRVLNNSKISTSFFEPSVDIPTLKHVRLVFLDLKFVPGASEDPADLAKGAAQYLGRLIDKDENGPYILFLWTKHEDKDSELANYVCPLPIAIVKMNKSKFRALPTMPAKIAHITTKLAAALAYSPFTKIVLDLEQSAKKASASALNAIVPAGCSKDDEIGANLHMLKKAAAGEQTGVEDVKVVKSVFSRLMADYMEMADSCAGALPAIAGAVPAISDATKARVNTALHLDVNPAMCMPGNIYKFDGPPLCWIKSGVDKNSGQVKDAWSALEQIRMEVSPVCEWSNGKQHNHRLLRGVIFPKTATIKAPSNEKFLHLTPFFMLNGNEVKFVFDLRCIETVENGGLAGKSPLCRLRSEILFEIQSLLAGSLVRLGITAVT